MEAGERHMDVIDRASMERRMDEPVGYAALQKRHKLRMPSPPAETYLVPGGRGFVLKGRNVETRFLLFAIRKEGISLPIQAALFRGNPVSWQGALEGALRRVPTSLHLRRLWRLSVFVSALIGSEGVRLSSKRLKRDFSDIPESMLRDMETTVRRALGIDPEAGEGEGKSEK
jgi:hypothetical protein